MLVLVSAAVNECCWYYDPSKVHDGDWACGVRRRPVNLSLKYNSTEGWKAKKRTHSELLAKVPLVDRSRFKSNKKAKIHMQFTKCHTQHRIHKYFGKCCAHFFVRVRFIRISSLSFALFSRFSIYVRLFGMLDIHVLRSPQIYHNNPSISESEYLGALKKKK